MAQSDNPRRRPDGRQPLAGCSGVPAPLWSRSQATTCTPVALASPWTGKRCCYSASTVHHKHDKVVKSQAFGGPKGRATYGHDWGKSATTAAFTMALVSAAPAKAAEGNNVTDLLANLDFSSIEEMDPSLADGHRVIYDREASLEVRVQEDVDGPQQLGTVETFKVKILLLGRDDNPTSVRVELSSEADLFFLYVHDLDEEGFRVMQQEQRLTVEFVDYPNVLIKALNRCITDPTTNVAAFILLPDSSARVDFYHVLEYKSIDLMQLPFTKCCDEDVQQHITYRYNAMKGRAAILQAHLQDISNLIKLKNPSLLLQLQRSPNIALVNPSLQGQYHKP